VQVRGPVVTPDATVAKEYAPSPQPIMVATPVQEVVGAMATTLAAEARKMEQDTRYWPTPPAPDLMETTVTPVGIALEFPPTVMSVVPLVPAVSITNLVAEIPPTTSVHVLVPAARAGLTVNTVLAVVTAAPNVMVPARAVEPQVPDTGAPMGTFVRVAATCAVIVTVVVVA